MKCSLLAERVKMILGNNDMSMQFESFLFNLFTISMPFILNDPFQLIDQLKQVPATPRSYMMIFDVEPFGVASWRQRPVVGG